MLVITDHRVIVYFRQSSSKLFSENALFASKNFFDDKMTIKRKDFTKIVNQSTFVYDKINCTKISITFSIDIIYQVNNKYSIF